MTIDAEALLSGPRGRRLCLHYAMRADDEVSDAVFALGRGLGRWGGSGRGEVVMRSELVHGEFVRDELAHDELVHESLRASVDSAMYWQEPDDEDVVAALPEMRAALVTVAERVLTSTVASTWSAPAGRPQWAVEWQADAVAAPRASATDLLAEWGEAIRAEEQTAARDRPASPLANWSGGWWSKPMRLLVTRSRIDDALELVEDPFDPEAATIIPMTGGGRTYEIDSPAAWAELCGRYPLEVTASRRHDWFRVTGWTGRWLIPDWQRVAEQWDAVHLTTAGYLSSATMLIPIDDEYGSVIGGWEPDATLWLTDVAHEAGAPRQQWRRPVRGDRWESTAG